MDELGDLELTLRFFRRMRDHFSSKLEALRALERQWAEADPHYPDVLAPEELHLQLALRKGLLSLEAHVAWCDEAIRRLGTRLHGVKPTRRGARRIQ
jgi:hypothetical protein